MLGAGDASRECSTGSGELAELAERNTQSVRASFVDASELQTNAFRVVTERGTVYLMGRVTQAEADRATQITRTIPGVVKVVRVFELVTISDAQPAKPATAAAPAQPSASAPR